MVDDLLFEVMYALPDEEPGRKFVVTPEIVRGTRNSSRGTIRQPPECPWVVKQYEPPASCRRFFCAMPNHVFGSPRRMKVCVQTLVPKKA